MGGVNAAKKDNIIIITDSFISLNTVLSLGCTRAAPSASKTEISLAIGNLDACVCLCVQM